MPADRNALVTEMRGFNRFYTCLVGLLDETLTHSAYTLAEARVLFELGRRPADVSAGPGGETGFLARAFHLGLAPAASALAGALKLPPAHLMRILRKFAAAGLTEPRADPDDRRRRILSLTARGNAALATLQAAADRDLARQTAGLADDEAAELSDALKRITRLLSVPEDSRALSPVG
ncbi:winged helix DNA-binding protein [Mesorhizobium sp. M0924]|uniref:MarR family transcriptional regulator n=1 Tax=unclassified Mesorhizobium TaxID=325217 RepID=UPI003336AC43